MIAEQRNTMIQEVYKQDPWKMLVCCIFLNQTTRDQVDKIRLQFFERYPDPRSIMNADPHEIAEIIKPLGFKNRRTATLINFSRDWVERQWSMPIELYGIGKYAQDSWDIFQLNNLNVTPTDGALISYLDKLKSQLS